MDNFFVTSLEGPTSLAPHGLAACEFSGSQVSPRCRAIRASYTHSTGASHAFGTLENGEPIELRFGWITLVSMVSVQRFIVCHHASTNPSLSETKKTPSRVSMPFSPIKPRVHQLYNPFRSRILVGDTRVHGRALVPGLDTSLFSMTYLSIILGQHPLLSHCSHRKGQYIERLHLYHVTICHLPWAVTTLRIVGPQAFRSASHCRTSCSPLCTPRRKVEDL